MSLSLVSLHAEVDGGCDACLFDESGCVLCVARGILHMRVCVLLGGGEGGEGGNGSDVVCF